MNRLEAVLQEKCQAKEVILVAKDKCRAREETQADKEKCLVKEAIHKEVTAVQKETEEVKFYI